MKRITVLIIAFFCASAFAQDLPKIAVYVTGLEDQNVNKAMAARMLSALVNSGKYSIANRQDEFMNQLKKQNIGTIDHRKIWEAGKQFNIDNICIVDITPALGSNSISVRIMDVASAKFVAMADTDSPLRTLQDLSDASAYIVATIFGVGKVQQATPYPTTQPVKPVQEASPVHQAGEAYTALTDFRDNIVGIPMVFVQGGGMFVSGKNGEPTQRIVTLSSFYIGKYEVTQRQWLHVMGSNPSYFQGSDLPVDNVSWNDIQEFISRLNSLTGKRYRLPTEAEWEYAARGGNKSKGYMYSGSNNINDVAWYYGNSNYNSTDSKYRKSRPFGIKRPNELGIYDMSGNVEEWVSDYYDGRTYASYDVATNPKGPESPISGFGRVTRGGSWLYSVKNTCHVSYRGGDSPDARRNNVGFRLAIDVQEIGPVQLSQPQQNYSTESGYSPLFSSTNSSTLNEATDRWSSAQTMPSAQEYSMTYEDFSTAQRLGTWLLNVILPGFGSLAIMQDNVGAGTLFGLTVGGVIFMLVGWSDVEITDSVLVYHTDPAGRPYSMLEPVTYTVGREPNALYWIGLIAGATGEIFNIVRSASYKKEIPQNAAYLKTSGLKWGVVPDRSGDVKAYLTYKTNF
jgi:formylglycine-generating enzyme required for sulfatase activity